jgi:uncharacterized protein
MKNAIILHGMPSRKEYYSLKKPTLSNAHWFPWLQKQLYARDIKADTPEVPHSYDPQWELWVREVERFEIDENTTLIGHSCGAGFWVKYLSIHKELKVGKVILVAPWIDPDNDEARDFFMHFKIDVDMVKRTKGITIFNSDNDMGNVHKTVALLREQIKDIEYQEFRKYGHFTLDHMKTDKFPELLKELI